MSVFELYHTSINMRSLRTMVILFLTVALILAVLSLKGYTKASPGHQTLTHHMTNSEPLNKSLQQRNTPLFPKIIHQSWKNEMTPKVFETWIRSWTKFHRPPEWQYYFWTDEGSAELVRRYYPDMKPTYDGYQLGVSRADAARVLVLHHYGGVYADLDVESLAPLDTYVSQHPCFMASNQPLHDLKEVTKQVINAVMGCVKQHKFVAKVIDRLQRPPKSQDILEVAGPKCVQHVLNDYIAGGGIDVTLADPVVFPAYHSVDSALWDNIPNM